MRRLFLLVVLLGLVGVAVVVVLLGTFPPERRPQHIEKVLSNDRFQHP